MTKKYAAAVFLFSLTLQTAVGLALARYNPEAFVAPDSRAYLACAADLRLGRADSIHCFMRAPGYPAALAMCGASEQRPQTALGMNRFLAACAATVFFWILSRFLPRPAAFGAALLFAADPLNLKLANNLLSETPYLFLFIVAFALFSSPSAPKPLWAAGSGVLFGLASLVRPLAILWPAVHAIILWWVWKRELRRPSGVIKNPQSAKGAIVVFLLAACAGPALLIAHNGMRFGCWTPAGTGVENLLYYKAAPVLMRGEGISREEAWHSFDGRLPAVTDPKRSRVAARVFLETIMRYPAAFVLESLRGVRKIVSDAAVPEFAPKGTRGRPLQQVFFYTHMAWSIALFVLACRGLLMRGPKSAEVWLSLAMIVYFLAVSVPGGNARFRIPILPALYLLAALNLQNKLHLARAKHG